jgi:hypothetical protein
VGCNDDVDDVAGGGIAVGRIPGEESLFVSKVFSAPRYMSDDVEYEST